MNLESHLRNIIHEAVSSAIKEEMTVLYKKLETAARSHKNTFSEARGLPDKRIIRPRELAKMLSLSVPTLYRMQQEGRLPQKIKFSHHAVGWLSTDIDEWLEQNKDHRSGDK